MLFGGLDTIYHLAAAFCGELELIDEASLIDEIGDVFVRFIPFFKNYISYVPLCAFDECDLLYMPSFISFVCPFNRAQTCYCRYVLCYEEAAQLLAKLRFRNEAFDAFLRVRPAWLVFLAFHKPLLRHQLS
jgi:hypothetical protein